MSYTTNVVEHIETNLYNTTKNILRVEEIKKIIEAKITSLFWQITAFIRGVWPALSVASTSAPSSIRSSHNSEFPVLDARCNGVQPT